MFDFSGNPDQLAHMQEQTTRLIEDLGGTSIRQAVGEPEVTSGDTERLLDGSLEWLFSGIEEISRHTPRGLFKREGIICPRDVLMIGRRTLADKFDGIGGKTIKSMQASFAHELPLIPFKAAPEVQDIAALCSRPDQIPLQAVIRRSLRNLWTGTPPARRVTLDDAINYTKLFQFLEHPRSLIAPTQEFYAELARVKGWPTI
jgi:hypothetical protein